MKIKILSKKRILVVVLAVFILLCAAVIIHDLTPEKKTDSYAESPGRTKTAEQTLQNQTQITEKAEQAKDYYIIKEYREKIGIFGENEDELFKVLDVYVDTLPRKDRDDLKKGIKIFSGEELADRIEDFDS
ncbi:MAG: hypothetical protein FWG69_04265 [Oscillospiraceae bacterium]|nr:hypothetical protein [Oscillospiraceae bacterium]